MSVHSKISKGLRLLASLATSPKPDELSTLIYSINSLCNTQCTMCNIWQKYRDNPALLYEELSLSEIQKAFRASNLLRRLNYILITGGEPFLKKDFVDIILFFYDLNPAVQIGIATNGRNTDLIIEKIHAIREGLSKRHLDNTVTEIGISIDGLEETHDSTRGGSGIFKKAMETVKQVKNISGVATRLSFTITPDNYKEFAEVYYLSCQLEVGFGFRFVQRSDHYYGNHEKAFVWKDDQLKEIGDVIKTMGRLWSDDRPTLSKLLDIGPYYYEMMMEYERSPRRLHVCYAGTHSCFLDSYGNIYPCIMLNKSIGNIREKNFDALWESQTVNNIRDSIARRKCHCYATCEVPRSLPRDHQVYWYNTKKVIGHRLNGR